MLRTAGVLISFREWLHSYEKRMENRFEILKIGSHLFQRVASFLRVSIDGTLMKIVYMFSSLSESGFIPTILNSQERRWYPKAVLISFREWLHSY